MSKRFPLRFLPAFFAFLAGFAVLGTARADSPEFARGVAAFQAGDYGQARTLLSTARDREPNDPLTNLWLGLAVYASGGGFDGAEQWRKSTGNPRYEPIADFFRGLQNWRAGWVNDARASFNDALVNVTDGQAVDFAPARNALANLAAGQSVPPIAQWPQLAGLPESADGAAPVNGGAKGATTAPRQPPARPATPPADAPVPVIAGYVPWESFGAHRVGDRVLFRVADAEWRDGVIREIGSGGAFANKYLIVDDRTGSTNYTFHTDVAGSTRAPFWTGFFIGTWALGSGMAVTERIDGGNVRNEYLYVGPSGSLEVRADGTYVWLNEKRERRTGRWEAAASTPGLIIRNGERDRDYEFYSITSGETIGIMKEHHARLRTPGIMTTLARRKLP